jgi:hypothetical protein
MVFCVKGESKMTQKNTKIEKKTPGSSGNKKLERDGSRPKPASRRFPGKRRREKQLEK